MMPSLRGFVVLGGLVVLAAGCSDSDVTPTFEVQRRPFVHRISAEGTLEASTATPLTVPPQVQGRIRVAWLATDGAFVHAGDPVGRLAGDDFERELETGRIDRTTAGLQIDKTEFEGESRVSSLESQRTAAQLDLAAARKFMVEDESIYSRHEVIESRIDEQLAAFKSDYAASQKTIAGEVLGKDLELLEIERRKADQQIDRATTALDALEIVAPHSGTVKLARWWNGDTVAVGLEVWPGFTLAELPDPETLQATVLVVESDAGGLAPGQKATVVVEAWPDLELAAEVKRVDKVPSQPIRSSPVQYFGVDLRFTDPLPEKLKTGQRVKATIILAEYDDAVVVPRQVIDDRGTDPRVWVQTDQGLSARQIEVAVTTAGWCVVSAGLEGGERVALQPPPTEEGDGSGDDGDSQPAAAGETT